MSNTPAMLQMILNSVPKMKERDAHGDEYYTADPDYLMYRFFDVDADNLPAFVEEAHACLDLVESYRGHLPPALWEQIDRDVRAAVKTSIVSITAASGAHAHLLGMLLRDVTESYHYLNQGPARKGGGIMDKFRSMGGDQEAQQRERAAQQQGGGGQGGGPPPDRTGGGRQ